MSKNLKILLFIKLCIIRKKKDSDTKIICARCIDEFSSWFFKLKIKPKIKYLLDFN